MKLKSYIDSIEDFPSKGILYRDIQPLLNDSRAFEDAIQGMVDLINIENVEYFAGIESRGFIFGTAMSWITNKGFKMIRKPGKLPGKILSIDYDLEYGSNTLEMQPGDGKVIIVDDVLATGGTINAAKQLATNAGYQVVDLLCLLDIGLLKEHNIKCLISY